MRFVGPSTSPAQPYPATFRARIQTRRLRIATAARTALRGWKGSLFFFRAAPALPMRPDSPNQPPTRPPPRPPPSPRKTGAAPPTRSSSSPSAASPSRRRSSRKSTTPSSAAASSSSTLSATPGSSWCASPPGPQRTPRTALPAASPGLSSLPVSRLLTVSASRRVRAPSAPGPQRETILFRAVDSNYPFPDTLIGSFEMELEEARALPPPVSGGTRGTSLPGLSFRRSRPLAPSGGLSVPPRLRPACRSTTRRGTR